MGFINSRSPLHCQKSSLMMFLLASAFVVVSLLGQVNSAEATVVAGNGPGNGTVADPGTSSINIPGLKLRFEPGPRQHNGRANNINDYYSYYYGDDEWQIWVSMTATGILSIIITVSIAACCFSCSCCPLRRRLDMFQNQNQNRGMFGGQSNFGYDAYGNRVMLSSSPQQQMIYSAYPQGNVVYQQQQQLPPQQQQQQQQQQQVMQQVVQPIQAPLGSVVVEPQNQ